MTGYPRFIDAPNRQPVTDQRSYAPLTVGRRIPMGASRSNANSRTFTLSYELLGTIPQARGAPEVSA